MRQGSWFSADPDVAEQGTRPGQLSPAQPATSSLGAGALQNSPQKLI